MEGKVLKSGSKDEDVEKEDTRYSGSDRRSKPTPMFSRYILMGGRRRHVRRTEERDGAFVDVHGPVGLIIVLAIVVLNLLDAYFTLLFLSHGGVELNPAALPAARRSCTHAQRPPGSPGRIAAALAPAGRPGGHMLAPKSGEEGGSAEPGGRRVITHLD